MLKIQLSFSHTASSAGQTEQTTMCWQYVNGCYLTAALLCSWSAINQRGNKVERHSKLTTAFGWRWRSAAGSMALPCCFLWPQMQQVMFFFMFWILQYRWILTNIDVQKIVYCLLALKSQRKREQQENLVRSLHWQLYHLRNYLLLRNCLAHCILYFLLTAKAAYFNLCLSFTIFERQIHMSSTPSNRPTLFWCWCDD